MRRAVLLVPIGVTVIAAAQCGGKIDLGHFDQDGDFLAPDGALVFGPGSSCKDYDASALVGTDDGWQLGNLSVDTSIPCDADAAAMDAMAGIAECESKLPPGLFFPIAVPGNVPQVNYDRTFFNTSCSGTCVVEQQDAPPCSGPNEQGDYYCRQFFQQFVAAPGAVARASCRACPEWHTGPYPCPGAFVCLPDCCPSVYGFCVQRGDAAPSCDEYPCKP